MTEPKHDPELVTLFTELNERHFDGLLPAPTYLRFDDPLPGFDGWGYFTMAGTKTIVVVTHDARRRGVRFYQDTMLHEMIHLAVGILDGTPSREHDDRFVKCNAHATVQGGASRRHGSLKTKAPRPKPRHGR